MKIKIIKNVFIVAFFGVFLSSQELDETFLDSLPNDIKDDVLERAENKGENIEGNYSKYQYSSKLEQLEELAKLKSRIESDLQELERRLSSDDKLDIEDDLILFGSNFFSTFQTSFMPINEPNPDSTYTLDVGDILNIVSFLLIMVIEPKWQLRILCPVRES